MFLAKGGDVLYVGKANDLKARVSSYFTNTGLLGEKTKVLVSYTEKIKVTIVESELEAFLLEAFYIKKYKPKYNIRLTDNKSYLRIRITVKDKYPKVLLARRIDDDSSLYFGPYPSSMAVKLVLKTIRRIFPYQSAFNHPKRICLYNHLGLCPCPEFFDSVKLQREYKKNIRGVIRILEGGSKKVMRDLEKKRDALSIKERFEEALVMQKKINALSFITTPYHRPFEYDVNPNLRVDLRRKEINSLIEILTIHGINIKRLRRIECYDISNTSGTLATGSMVVLIDGEKDSSQYRRFKIRKDGKPNDFAMITEVIKRRFTHHEWDWPDLIVVDGGKGQVSSVLQALSERNVKIPVIGLAKREETIIIPFFRHSESVRTKNPLRVAKRSLANSQDDNIGFKEILLPKDSHALHLVMRIRDEAHRFAITYHRKLRSRNTFATSV